MNTEGKPIIGLTPLWDKEKCVVMPMQETYLEAVQAAGGEPLVLDVADEEGARAELAGCDALISTGGGDIAPELYGEARIETCGPPCPARDTFELITFHIALERGMPILGICRGIQLINVGLGGTLWQHIGDAGVEPARHSAGTEPVFHGFKAAKGTPLVEWAGAEEFVVNSWHHQSVKRPGKGLEVVGWSDDGLIEAVWMPDRPFVWGVQWHPERAFHDFPRDLRIFQTLVAAAANHKKENHHGTAMDH